MAKNDKNDIDKKIKNKDFVMFFRDHMTELRWLSRENPTAYQIFMFFCEHMDRGNGLVCPLSILEDYFGYSKRTIQRAIKHLSDNGFICVLKVGTSNAYVINPQIAWTSKRNGLEYCQFNGNILIDRKQNMDYSLDKQRLKMKNYSTKAKQIPGQLAFSTYTEELMKLDGKEEEV